MVFQGTGLERFNNRLNTSTCLVYSGAWFTEVHYIVKQHMTQITNIKHQVLDSSVESLKTRFNKTNIKACGFIVTTVKSALPVSRNIIKYTSNHWIPFVMQLYLIPKYYMS